MSSIFYRVTIIIHQVTSNAMFRIGQSPPDLLADHEAHHPSEAPCTYPARFRSSADPAR